MQDLDYATHLKELRRTYIESLPAQRLHIARTRLANPEHDPNLLVAHVAAVEGYARSVAMHLRANTKPALTEIYATYRNRSAEELVSEITMAIANASPQEYFGASVWDVFLFSVSYRNLLVHECTYLGQDRSVGLIESCKIVLDRLVDLATARAT